MAKWKEIPLGKVKNLFMDAQEKLEDEKMDDVWLRYYMDALLDDVFYKVIGRVPVAKYEEGITGYEEGITGPQDCTDYVCFCETEEMQCGDRIEKENE